MTHPLQFIGFTSHRAGSESRAPSGPVLDPGYVVRMAQLHEQAGFDRVLSVFGHMFAPDHRAGPDDTRGDYAAS